MWVENASVEIEHDSRYPMFICVCTVMVFLMTVAVALRAYNCAWGSRRVGADDWATFVSAVCLSLLYDLCDKLTFAGSYSGLYNSRYTPDTPWAGISSRVTTYREY